MSIFQNNYKIIQVKQLNPCVFDFTVLCPDIAKSAKAGQFVHILCGDHTLRRPISICEINSTDGTIRFVFEVKGEGTSWLSLRKEGDMLDILGPLGNGFDPALSDKKAIVIGGGIGIPPMLEAAKLFKNKTDAVLGFRTKDMQILTGDFDKVCKDVAITSDDGTIGQKGFVTDALKGLLESRAYDVILACGPLPMLKGVAKIAEARDIDCFISMEERMGCGIGACLVCACKTNISGKISYSHVCKDGPVFNAREVVFDG